jgi:IS4 transposase
LLTNNFELEALEIGRLYRQRWQVELFFKWVKQHLCLRGFYGRSANAVRCQIWAAISAYLMVAIIRKQLGIKKSLYEILQIVSVNAFAQVPLSQLLEELPASAENNDSQKSLILNL